MSDNQDFPDNSGSEVSTRSPVEPTKATRDHLQNQGVPMAAKVLLAAIAIVVMAAIVFLTKTKTSQSAHPTPTMADADPDEAAKRPPVQDFILTDETGVAKKLSDFRGNVVILSFWASWCAPCLEELPTFGQLSKKFETRGLKVLPVNVEEGDDGKAFAKTFWAAQKFSIPSFFDTSKALASQFQVEQLPSNFVIDREGRLAFSGFGANDWTSEENIEFLEALLNEKPAGNSPN